MVPHLQIYFETFWFCILWALRPRCPLAKASSFLNPIQNRLIPRLSFLFHLISKTSSNHLSARSPCSPARERIPFTWGPAAGIAAPRLPSRLSAALPCGPSRWLTRLRAEIRPQKPSLACNVCKAFSGPLYELALYKLPCTVILGALYSAIRVSYWKSWQF